MSHSPEQRSPSSSELPRKLGLLSAIAVLVGSTIGSAIFRSPAGIATKVPDEALYILIWLLGGFFAMCGALTYSELSSALPRTGGVFVYLREGFGRLPAFLFGWAELTIVRASALGAIATVFAEYLLRLAGVAVRVPVETPAGIVEQSAPSVHYVAAAAILVVATFNFVGVSFSALVQNMTTVAKYGALVLLVAAAFLIGGVHPAPEVLQPSLTAGPSVKLFGLALISVLWAYDGWADVTFVSGEVKRPERNLVLALMIGTGSVIVIYLLANFAYLHLLDMKQIAGSALVAADSAERIVGAPGARLASIAVMISAFGTLNGSMMTGPRIFFAMADEGLFFKRIASVHPRFKTPYVAISLAAVLAIGFVMIRTFEQLADTFVLGIWPFYAGGVAAVYTLRRKQPGLQRSYRVFAYPVTPALFLLAAVFLLGNAIITDVGNVWDWLSRSASPADTGSTLLVFVIILAGVPAFWLWERLNSKGNSKQSPGS